MNQHFFFFKYLLKRKEDISSQKTCTKVFIAILILRTHTGSKLNAHQQVNT